MTHFQAFHSRTDGFRHDLQPLHGEVTYSASTEATLAAGDAEKMLKMIDQLEDLDDVQEVYSNADIPDEVMAALD